MKVMPLNGEKTHPLSQAALDVLRKISRAPVPRCEVNPGVVNRLEREALVEEVALASPFKTRKGLVRHLQITATGRERLR